MNKAQRIKNSRIPDQKDTFGGRLPPGQTLTEKFPILHEGEVPEYDLTKWELSIFGEGIKSRSFTYEELMRMPQSTIVKDIHCVTRWSKFDNEFKGIKFLDFLKEAAIEIPPSATHIMIYGDHDYDTNLPIEDLLRDDILLAHSYEGKPLTPKHGWPLRLIVPHLYFWKSVKWLRGFEFMSKDRNGFWEKNGFHHYGDVFKEERFSGEDLDIPEDEWKKKDFD
ncbi:sulfite oxidase-like oxidoreductase [Jeotgalibacillus proteolyticus]|uniref:Sulfite oxidase-like oxidoreductase n=1 Tax=Jeotgalibacillus proteolyticus TaxID=2082395 RepID=A0A2S5GAC3_9BACL|nr:sulfite oxidase-like oxidoreductase [Jeotgalibacillus proteolyticus]PPA69864.1 sulfite oxidase-like oxidoreductase [Jeotgalibacillus proteolyticus]